MKLIIDIPDEDYKFIKDLQSLIIGSRGNCKTIQKNVINAIKNGIPYEERPQGDINSAIKTIKAVCKDNNICTTCPMNGNCNEQPAKWEEVQE